MTLQSQAEATAQPTKPTDEIQPAVEEEAQAPELPLLMMAKSPSHSKFIVELKHPKSYTFGVGPAAVELTTTPEPIKEVDSSLAQQVAPALSSVSPEPFEPWQVGQAVTTQQPDPIVMNDHSPVDQGVPVQPKELPEKHSLNQQENSALSSKPAESGTL